MDFFVKDEVKITFLASSCTEGTGDAEGTGL